MIKQKYFRFCGIYTVSNLLDSTNLIKLISLCFSYNFSVADSLTTCVTFFFLKTYNWFCRMQLILILNCFLNSVNLFIFFFASFYYFFPKQCFINFQWSFSVTLVMACLSHFFILPLLTGNGCFCIFQIWIFPTSTCSHFWSYYNWLNAVIIDL